LCGIVLFIGVVADTKLDMSSPNGFCKSVTKDDVELKKCIKQYSKSCYCDNDILIVKEIIRLAEDFKKISLKQLY